MLWTRLPFTDAISDVTRGNAKTLQSDYLESGSLPIIDQGKLLIGGYTNNRSAAFSGSLPVIIFGDHTCALKYVDFPFGMGADGVKVLKVGAGADPRFVYRYLCTIALPDVGYSRHFKFLKETRIPMPPIGEQRRIADILDHADALRAKRQEALALLDDLAQSIFWEMFGDPIANDRGFPIKPMIEWIDPGRPITYGILKPGDDQPDGVPYVRVVDMKDRAIDASGLRRTSLVISNQYRRSLLNAGDLLMSIRGHVGRLAIVPVAADGANITQDSARLAVGSSSRTYMLECLRTDAMQHWMRQRTKGAAVKGINLGDLKMLPVPEPPAEMQGRFAERARAVDEMRLIAVHQRLLADEAFASLQQRAFAGQL